MASKEETDQKEQADATSVTATLLERCRFGDRFAQHRLYELCQRQVHRHMVRMVGLEDAPDVTQQVFLQVFRKLNQFKGRSNFQTWLYRLASNEALQYLRKEDRWNFQPISRDPMSDHLPQKERIEQRELLDQALSRVDPELRSIFLLREVEGLSYREIATVFEIHEGTVGSRLNRARRELQQHLADLDWEP